jgi:NitT/TauT family transport system permease protein
MSTVETTQADRPAAERPVAERRAPGLFNNPALVERTLPWVIIVAFFILWEIGSRLIMPLFSPRPDIILPAPSAVFPAMLADWKALLDNALYTLKTTLIGFAIAIVVGVIGGIAIGSSRLMYAGFYPILIGFNAIPKIAIVPVLVLWFGIGTMPAILTAFLISFFPILVNVATGIATVEPELKDVLRALGAKNRDIVWKIGLPRAMPYFFASLKVAITVAFVGSILAESTAGNHGIGHLTNYAAAQFRVPLVFGGLIVTAAMGIMLYYVAAIIEKRMTGWATRGMDTPGAGY